MVRCPHSERAIPVAALHRVPLAATALPLLSARRGSANFKERITLIWWHRLRRRLGLPCKGIKMVMDSPTGQVQVVICECGSWRITVGERAVQSGNPKDIAPLAWAFRDDLDRVGETTAVQELDAFLKGNKYERA